MKTNNEIDEMIKDYIGTIYEVSDDNMVPSNPSDYSDLLDDTLDTIDLSKLQNLIMGNNTTQIDSDSDITIRVNGKDRNVSELFNTMDTIEKRLGILRPDPKLLDKYELLQSLYEQYKAAEAMLYEGNNEEEEFPF